MSRGFWLMIAIVGMAFSVLWLALDAVAFILGLPSILALRLLGVFVWSFFLYLNAKNFIRRWKDRRPY